MVLEDNFCSAVGACLTRTPCYLEPITGRISSQMNVVHLVRLLRRIDLEGFAGGEFLICTLACHLYFATQRHSHSRHAARYSNHMVRFTVIKHLEIVRFLTGRNPIQICSLN